MKTVQYNYFEIKSKINEKKLKAHFNIHKHLITSNNTNNTTTYKERKNV